MFLFIFVYLSKNNGHKRNNNMIRLNESQLKQIISENVRNALNEVLDTPEKRKEIRKKTERALRHFTKWDSFNRHTDWSDRYSKKVSQAKKLGDAIGKASEETYGQGGGWDGWTGGAGRESLYTGGPGSRGRFEKEFPMTHEDFIYQTKSIGRVMVRYERPIHVSGKQEITFWPYPHPYRNAPFGGNVSLKDVVKNLKEMGSESIFAASSEKQAKNLASWIEEVCTKKVPGYKKACDWYTWFPEEKNSEEDNED